MGLDGVELIIAVEDEFQIAIEDAEAEKCVTVQKLVELVYSRLRHTKTEPCLSQQGFYVVRKALMDILPVKRSMIKPDTKLEDLIENSNRRTVWRKIISSFTESANITHSLVRPKWLNLLVFFILPILVCVGNVIFHWFPLVLSIPAGITTAVFGSFITSPWKQMFPSKFSTVKDLIRFVATLETSVWTEDEVFQKIKHIIVEHSGVKESDVTPETDFVKDLGI